MSWLNKGGILTKTNISTFISEISGSFGDIGTFLPLAISLAIVTNGNINFTGILVTTGVFNILNGIIFRLPMPLQPMKAIAAEAITKNIDNVYIICSAGLVVGGIVFVIGFLLMVGLTNDKLEKIQQSLIPKSLICGIQVGLGLGLCKAGVEYVYSDYMIGVPTILVMLILTELDSDRYSESTTKENPCKQEETKNCTERNIEEGLDSQISHFSSHHTSHDGENEEIKIHSQTSTDLDSDDNPNACNMRAATPLLDEQTNMTHLEHHLNTSKVTKQKMFYYFPIPVGLISFFIGIILAVVREDNNSLHSSFEMLDHKNEYLDNDSTSTRDANNYSVNAQGAHGPNSTTLPLQFIDPYLLWNEGLLNGGLILGLTQLPLTSLNSVVSISDLSEKLYGKKRKVPSVYLAVSVGLTNILFSFLGTMPVCHGAGGLAAQHKFGSRTGWSIIFLGCIKIMVALIFRRNDLLLTALRNYPLSVLGSMLLFVGTEFCLHSLKGLFQNESKKARDKDVFVFITVVGVQLATNTGWGFLSGLVAHTIMTTISVCSQKCNKQQKQTVK